VCYGPASTSSLEQQRRLICCARKVCDKDDVGRMRRTWRSRDIPGKQLVFVTNNSTKSRADYKKKFDSMGISASEVCISEDTLHRVDSTS
jgi:hypothetical protein